MTDEVRLRVLIGEYYQNTFHQTDRGLVEYLMAHDVVVREKGEWELYPSSEYRRCRVCKMEYEKARFGVRANFCPNCGADMRKGENDG